MPLLSSNLGVKAMASYPQMRDLLISVFLTLFMAGCLVEARTRCFSAKGKVLCHANSTRHADVEIYLMDDDGMLNQDDTMGWTTSDLDGTFKVEGCGYDWLSDPDPYLKILNPCNGNKMIKTRANMPYMFAPEIIDAGVIELDG